MNKRIILGMVIVLLIGATVGCTTMDSTTATVPQVQEVKPAEEVKPNEVVEELPLAIPEKVEEPEYMTSGEWALTDAPYAFAVEIEDYNGDIYKAGKYSFELIGGRLKAGKSQTALFGIYVAEKSYADTIEMAQDFSEATLYVGGMMNTSQEFELKKGQYVYVIPEPSALPSTGFLSIDMMN